MTYLWIHGPYLVWNWNKKYNFRNDFEIFHVSKVFLNLCFHYYDLWHSASIPVFLRHRIAFWRHTSPTKDGSITLVICPPPPPLFLFHKKQDWKWSTDLIIVFRTWQNKCISSSGPFVSHFEAVEKLPLHQYYSLKSFLTFDATSFPFFISKILKKADFASFDFCILSNFEWPWDSLFYSKPFI